MWKIAFKTAFGWLVDLLSGWLLRRHLQQETQRADQAEARTQADEQIIQAQKDRIDVDQKVLAAGPDAARDDMRDHWNEP